MCYNVNFAITDNGQKNTHKKQGSKFRIYFPKRKNEVLSLFLVHWFKNLTVSHQEKKKEKKKKRVVLMKEFQNTYILAIIRFSDSMRTSK